MADESLLVVEPPFEPTRDARVAGVVLAAGTSTRFGDDNKLLADVDGQPLVRRAVAPFLDAAIDPVVVVVGHESDRVRAALASTAVQFVDNPAYVDGQATSVRVGVDAVADATLDAVVVGLGDMPFVRTRTVELLVAAYRAGAGDVLAAAADGQRGNPVLFDASYADALRELTGDSGARSLVLEHGTLVETGDPGVARDVDTPA
ncbi:MAG: NTP transferase domain-containing protein [Haloplanus sp.]